jgi:ATP-binding cassette subfamily B protein
MMSRSMALARYTSGLFPVMILATGASTALVLWFGGRDVVSGRITIGQFVQFSAYLGLLASQLASVGWTIASWQQGSVSLKRINEILRTTPRVRDPEDARTPPVIRGEIEFRGVSTTYGDRPVLRDINLRIEAGSTVALVGATGSGKTTLAALLPRLLDPSAGAVLIDGVDAREWPLARLRDAIGFVPQESFLFSDSLRDNVTFGRLEATEAELAAALEASQLVNDLEQFPHGIDTVIGERGVTLSGGQKQRAALARALVKDPPILVLDDALSHVDTHTEEEILRHLREYTRGRTTILIAHRTSTLRGADTIVALEDGTVAEVGTHEALLDAGGVYARLYHRQRAEELAARGAVDLPPEALEAAGGTELRDAGGGA